MNRSHWLVLTIVTLVVGNLLWYVWSHWGLITIHSENKPLAEIIHAIEKQGGITLKTDVDLNTPVRMYVKNVTLPEALETLSALTESRWRLSYLVASDKSSIALALSQFTSGQHVEGWKAVSVPLAGMSDEPFLPPDPRADVWDAKPAKEPKLQSYLQQAARTVSASFMYPESWNPDIAKPPKAGPIHKSLPRLADAAHGRYEEIFLLQKSGRRGGPPGRDAADTGDTPRPAVFDAGGSRTGFERERMDREAVDERMQAEIDKLPPAQRAAAQQERDERRKFFEEMRDLPPEQRAAKIQEFLENPTVAERFEKGLSAREARQSPQQKLDRAHKYLDNKAQIRSGGAPAGGGGRP